MTDHLILDVLLAITTILALMKLGGGLKAAALTFAAVFALVAGGLYIWFAVLTGYWQFPAMFAAGAVINVAADQARKNKGAK